MDELRAALELATDDELQLLTDILFRRKFNPLDYVCAPDPLDVQSQDRETWLYSLEERFRFLAADGVTVLRGRSHQVSYRQVLIRVCRYLQVPYHQNLSTAELEAEIFLTLLHRAWKQLPPQQQRVFRGELQRAVTESELARQLPANLQNNPAGLLLKGSSALAVNSLVRPWLLHTMARQFALQAATYEVARQAALQGGAIATQATLQAASRRMALSAARYTAARSVFAFLGPALWACFFADLGWRAIATNYSRVIPVIFTLAQIRLTRELEYQMA